MHRDLSSGRALAGAACDVSPGAWTRAHTGEGDGVQGGVGLPVAAAVGPVAAGLLVSPHHRAEFGNGEQFYAHAGQTIAVPERRAERPHRDALEWHLDTVFKSS